MFYQNFRFNLLTNIHSLSFFSTHHNSLLFLKQHKISFLLMSILINDISITLLIQLNIDILHSRLFLLNGKLYFFSHKIDTFLGRNFIIEKLETDYLLDGWSVLRILLKTLLYNRPESFRDDVFFIHTVPVVIGISL
jgi:hypothetical protein